MDRAATGNAGAREPRGPSTLGAAPAQRRRARPETPCTPRARHIPRQSRHHQSGWTQNRPPRCSSCRPPPARPPAGVGIRGGGPRGRRGHAGARLAAASQKKPSPRSVGAQPPVPPGRHKRLTGPRWTPPARPPQLWARRCVPPGARAARWPVKPQRHGTSATHQPVTRPKSASRESPLVATLRASRQSCAGRRRAQVLFGGMRAPGCGSTWRTRRRDRRGRHRLYTVLLWCSPPPPVFADVLALS